MSWWLHGLFGPLLKLLAGIDALCRWFRAMTPAKLRLCSGWCMQEGP